MQFTTALLALAATAVALPNVGPAPAKGSQVGGQQTFWPVSDDVTVEEAKAACGTDNQIACCDDTTFTGDQVEVASGPLAGALKDLLGGKNGAKGLGLFDKCSKLNIDRKFQLLSSSIILGTNILQSSSVSPISSTASASRTLLAARATLPTPLATLSDSTFLVSLLVLFCKGLYV